MLVPCFLSEFKVGNLSPGAASWNSPPGVHHGKCYVSHKTEKQRLEFLSCCRWWLHEPLPRQLPPGPSLLSSIQTARNTIMQRHLCLLVAACIWRRWGDANRETEGIGCLSYLCFDAYGPPAGLYASMVTDLPLCYPLPLFQLSSQRCPLRSPIRSYSP